MITVVFKNIVIHDAVDFGNESNIYLEVSGHSGINKKGSDILCSAISALSQTFILTVDRVLMIKQQISREDGFISSLINLEEVTAENRSKLKLLIESLLIGFLEIGGEYPDKIKIEFVND